MRFLNKTILFAIIIVIALAVAGYTAFQTANQPATNTNQSNQTNTETNTPSITNPEVKTFDIVGTPFAYAPNEIRVKKGDTVKINFTNNEGFHDLTIEGYDMKTKQLQAGQSETIEFVADKEGSFTYYCSVPGHREKGMVGSLIVE